MKVKTIHILPIILAVVLPALRIFYEAELRPEIDASVITVYIFSSLILYNAWYLFWLLWDVKKGNNKWYVLVLIGTQVMLMALFSESGKVNMDGAIGRILLPFLLFGAIQYALKSQQKASHLFLETEQLQKENYKAQLKALRAQVDPHFLFNSLNTLRSMVRQQHAGSEQFILSLSDFYRQTLQHNEHTTILLSKELSVLQSYLFLMKSRNEKAVQINFDIDDSLLEYQIPAMALQTVVENCFKHNSMTSKSPLQIDISSSGDLFVRVCNNLQPKITEKKNTGMGLELLRKRYELMNVPNGLTFEQTSEQFCVNLKLV